MDCEQCALSLSSLVAEHYALLYRYAYRLSGNENDAEDLTQQAFLIAQSKLDQLREAARAKSWLCAILRNLYLKDLRDRRVSVSAFMEDLPAGNSASRDSGCDPEKIQQLLSELPEAYRSPVILFYFNEFSYKEIASQLDVPVGTVMSRLARAKAFLRERLAPELAEQTAQSLPTP